MGMDQRIASKIRKKKGRLNELLFAGLNIESPRRGSGAIYQENDNSWYRTLHDETEWLLSPPKDSNKDEQDDKHDDDNYNAKEDKPVKEFCCRLVNCIYEETIAKCCGDDCCQPCRKCNQDL